jgi:hypothetical protein
VGNGWGSCSCNFDFDIAVIYNALEEVGYTTHYNPAPVPPNTGPNESNVIVLYDNGLSGIAGKTIFHNDWDGPCECIPPPYISSCGACASYRNEVDYEANKQNIIDVFTSLSIGGTKELSTEDQLFVYITGTGIKMNNGVAAFECYTPPTTPPTPPVYITATELRDAVKNINCSQMVFVMQQNYSGGFIDILTDITDPSIKCKNRVVITATGDGTSSSSMGYSYKELWMHCGNIGEFTYYFAAALRGYYEGRFPWQWSYAVGELPFTDLTNGIDWYEDGCDKTIYPSANDHPHPLDYNPDSGTPPYSSIVPGNNDGYVQLIEAFNYAKCMDTWCLDGYKNQRRIMSVQDPTGPNPPNCIWKLHYTNVNCNWDFETPQIKASNGFTLNNFMCLNGIAGKVSHSLGPQTFTGSRSYLLGGNLIVQSDMTISQDTKITIGVDNAKIDVDANSLFIVNTGLKLKGLSSSASNNELIVRNYNNQLNLKGVEFTAVSLDHYGSRLNIGDPGYPSIFTGCPYIRSKRGMVNIIHSTFNNSTVNLQGTMSLTDEATVDYCTFNGNNTSDGCQIIDYKKYSITNNNFTDGGYGLYLAYLGSSTGDHLIRNNHISGCYGAGICIYSSEASLDMNQIENSTTLNGYPGKGLEIFNNSNISMTGNANAQNILQTQLIKDCDGIEFYATEGCLPYYMRYNGFIDNDNIPGDPIFFYDNSKQKFPVGYSIGYNCWGDNFNPTDDLKVNFGQLGPYPIWCPPFKGMMLPQDEDMYNTAITYVDSGLYSQAINLFQLLIESYPKSIYAQASMKALYETEFYADNDFSGLQVFYLTNDSILADTSLAKLGDFLSNKCDIQLHNYESAISWYENKIQNSTDPNDSVFSIIDLGHLYSTMDSTGDGPTYIGSMPQYKPTSQARYIAYRDSLISLLPFKKDHANNRTPKLMIGQLLKIVPNPSKSSTDFYVKISGAKNADIKIFNSLGKLEQTVLITSLDDTPQKITFNTSVLSPGIYECMLNVNGKRTDTKKLIVIR